MSAPVDARAMPVDAAAEACGGCSGCSGVERVGLKRALEEEWRLLMIFQLPPGWRGLIIHVWGCLGRFYESRVYIRIIRSFGSQGWSIDDFKRVG